MYIPVPSNDVRFGGNVYGFNIRVFSRDRKRNHWMVQAFTNTSKCAHLPVSKGDLYMYMYIEISLKKDMRELQHTSF